jgi:hypothetical protein
MKRRYLSSLLRSMRYHRAYKPDEGDSYMLQIVDDYRMVFSEIADSAEALVEQVKATGIQVWGQHYLDYLSPGNALEKKMVDDLVQLSNIVSRLLDIEQLQSLGYSEAEAKAIMKNAAYVGSEQKEKGEDSA